MNVRIFWVRAMKCMYAQTRPRFILSSEGVLGGMEFEPMLTPREKSPLPKMSPEEDWTRDAVDIEPKHYQLSYSGPKLALTTLAFLAEKKLSQPTKHWQFQYNTYLKESGQQNNQKPAKKTVKTAHIQVVHCHEGNDLCSDLVTRHLGDACHIRRRVV